jgi:hypothetical protein
VEPNSGTKQTRDQTRELDTQHVIGWTVMAGLVVLRAMMFE